MDAGKIMTDLNVIFKDVLDNDDIKVNADTTAKDIEEWDSLSNIQLIVAIEKHFKLRFTTSEIQNWRNVGELVQNIEKKANS